MDRLRAFRISLAIAALAAVVLTGCRVNRPANDHAKQQILYDTLAGDPHTFNPVLVTDATSGSLLGDTFEGLITLNPKTTLPESRLAESWEIGDGGKSITFHLRHAVKWSDGEPFTSHDVAFTMRAIYDKRVPNSMRPILLIDGKPIEVQTPDQYTVVMRLPRPFAPLLYSIGFEILPAHILEKALDDGSFTRTWGIDTSPAKIVGLGSFLPKRYIPAQVATLERNPDFWMKDDHGGELPRLHGKTYLIVQDRQAAYMKFLSGQTDVYNPHPNEVLDLRGKAKSLGITITDIGVDTGTLFFCFNRNPRHYVKNGKTDPKLEWFTDLNFLRAIAHSIDKQGMINLCYHGLAEPAVSDISPANKVFHDPNLKDYEYDLKLAAQMLEAGGYHRGPDGKRVDAHGNPIVFNLATNTGSPERDQMCAIVKQDLATLGITVNYRPLEFTTLVEKLDTSFDWDCVLIGFTGTVEPNNGANFLRSSGNLHLWYPDQPKPATPWEAEIDKLLDEGTAEMDVQKRVPYYWRIQEILHDQLPIIETVRQLRYDARRDSLENYDLTVWGLYRPEYIQFREN